MTSLYGSEIGYLFQILNAMSRNYFPMQLVPIWRGFLNRANCDISSNFCVL